MTKQKKHSEDMNPPTRWRHRPERTGKQKQVNTNPGIGSKATEAVVIYFTYAISEESNQSKLTLSFLVPITKSRE